MAEDRLLQSAIEGILATLDNSVLSRHALEATFNEPTGELVRIVFKDNPHFRFSIFEPGHPSPSWKVEEAPGKYLVSEDINTFGSFEHCINRLPAWLNRLISELTVTPPRSWADVARFRGIIEQYAQTLENPDQPFEGEHAEQWQRRVEDITARLDELAEENQELRSDVNRLKIDLQRLKDSVDEIPKRSWVRAFGGRMVDFLEKLVLKTDLSRTVVGTTIRLLLPEGLIPDDVLPELPSSPEERWAQRHSPSC